MSDPTPVSQKTEAAIPSSPPDSNQPATYNQNAKISSALHDMLTGSSTRHVTQELPNDAGSTEEGKAITKIVNENISPSSTPSAIRLARPIANPTRKPVAVFQKVLAFEKDSTPTESGEGDAPISSQLKTAEQKLQKAQEEEKNNESRKSDRKHQLMGENPSLDDKYNHLDTISQKSNFQVLKAKIDVAMATPETDKKTLNNLLDQASEQHEIYANTLENAAHHEMESLKSQLDKASQTKPVNETLVQTLKDHLIDARLILEKNKTFIASERQFLKQAQGQMAPRREFDKAGPSAEPSKLTNAQERLIAEKEGVQKQSADNRPDLREIPSTKEKLTPALVKANENLRTLQSKQELIQEKINTSNNKLETFTEKHEFDKLTLSAERTKYDLLNAQAEVLKASSPQTPEKLATIANLKEQAYEQFSTCVNLAVKVTQNELKVLNEKLYQTVIAPSDNKSLDSVKMESINKEIEIKEGLLLKFMLAALEMRVEKSQQSKSQKVPDSPEISKPESTPPSVETTAPQASSLYRPPDSSLSPLSKGLDSTKTPTHPEGATKLPLMSPSPSPLYNPDRSRLASLESAPREGRTLADIQKPYTHLPRMQFNQPTAVPQKTKIQTNLLDESPPEVQKTAVDTQLKAEKTIPRDIPPTETNPIEATQTKEITPEEAIESGKNKVTLFCRKVILNSEQKFLANLGVMQEVKEMFTNPNSPDGMIGNEFRNQLSEEQKPEFNRLLGNLKDSNIRALKEKSAEFNAKLEIHETKLQGFGEQLENINEQLNDTRLPDEKRKELQQAKDHITKEMESATLAMVKEFTDFKFSDSLNLAAEHASASNDLNQFIASNGLSTPWATTLAKFAEGKSPIHQAMTAGKDPFMPVAQVYTKYSLLARDLKESYKNLTSVEGYAELAPKIEASIDKFDKSTTLLNTAGGRIADNKQVTKKAQELREKIVNNKNKEGKLEAEKRPRRDAMVRKQGGELKRTLLSEIKTLDAAIATLDEGIKVQKNIIAAKSEEARNTKDPLRKAELQQDIEYSAKTQKELLDALTQQKKTPWAQKLEYKRLKHGINPHITEAKQALNIHEPKANIIFSEAKELPTELKNLNDLAKKMALRPGYSEAGIAAFENRATLIINNAVSSATQTKTYESASGTIANNKPSQETMDRTSAEINSLQKLASQHPEFPELKTQADSLLKAFNEKKAVLEGPALSTNGNEALSDDISLLSDTIKMIENGVTHKQEIQILQNPEAIAKREEKNQIQQKLSELEQLKNTLNEAIASNKKLSLTTGQLTAEKHMSDFGSIGNIGMGSFQANRGKNPEAVEFLLRKLSNNAMDPDLRVKTREIVDLIINEQQNKNDSWVKTVLKENPELVITLNKIIQEIESKGVNKTEGKTSAVVKDTKDELLDPPGNPEFQKAFLQSYRGNIIENLTGDKSPGISDSQKLFNFIGSNFEKAETSLYQKQQLISLAEQWVKDPFINNNEVSTRKTQIQDLINQAAKDGSPALRALSNQLSKSLNEADIAEIAAQTKTETPNGTLSIKDTIGQIAQGLDPKSVEYNQAVKNFASSITAQSASTFNAIQSGEFRNAKWENNSTQAPNLAKSAEDATALSRFVTFSILAPRHKDSDLNAESILNPTQVVLSSEEQVEKQKEAAKVFEFFVHVQQELLSPSVVNLDSFIAIEMGLNSFAVERLKNSMALVPDEIKEMSSSWKGLIEAEGNYRAMREKMKELTSKNQPYIPYMGIIKKDFIGSSAGNSSLSGSINNIGSAVNSVNKIQKKLKPIEFKANYKLDEIATPLSTFEKAAGSDKNIEEVKADELLDRFFEQQLKAFDTAPKRRNAIGGGNA